MIGFIKNCIDLVLDADFPVVREIAGQVVMHECGTFGGRVHHRDNGRQFFEVELDQFRRIARLFLGFCDHNGEVVAHVTHLVRDKGRVERLMHRDFVFTDYLPAAGQTTDFVSGPVSTRQNHDDAGSCLGFGRIDAFDLCVCNRRPHHPGVSLARSVEVVDVPSRTGQKALIFAAFDRCTD